MSIGALIKYKFGALDLALQPRPNKLANKKVPLGREKEEVIKINNLQSTFLRWSTRNLERALKKNHKSSH